MQGQQAKKMERTVDADGNVHYGVPFDSNLSPFTHRSIDVGPSKIGMTFRALVLAGLILMAPAYFAGDYYFDFTDNQVAGNESLIGLIIAHEVGKRGFSDYNRGTIKCQTRKHRTRKDLDLEEWSVTKIVEWQSRDGCRDDRLFAVGAFQIIPSTMKLAIENDPSLLNARFSKSTQKRIAAGYLLAKKRKPVWRYITGKGSLNRAVDAVAYEWASFKKANGVGAHDHKPPNKAVVDPAKTKAALKRAKLRYQQLVGSGMAKDRAFSLAVMY